MSLNASEAKLHGLAGSAFLAPWTMPNVYRTAGKELADLVVVFGNDILIFSDKASTFGLDPVRLRRWRRATIEASVKQLGGALRELASESPRLFEDDRATIQARLTEVLPPSGSRRFHLIAVARPDHDPSVTPDGWSGLRTTSETSDDPLEITPFIISGHLVHVIDGPTIDILLRHLDTAPDLVTYLRGRERALLSGEPHSFYEVDLLAASIANWEAGEGRSPEVPEISEVSDGQWTKYNASEVPALSQAANTPSYNIDRLIAHFHEEYSRGAILGQEQSYSSHELAMRLFASESRFARRMIAAPLNDLLKEPDQSKFASVTVPSPTHGGLRYVWLTYPQPPQHYPSEIIELDLMERLGRRVLKVAAQFKSHLVVGVILPNRECRDNVYGVKLLDASGWTDHDRAQGLMIDDDFGAPESIDYLHRP